MKKFRKICLFLIAIIIASTAINPISNVLATNDFYSSNDILFYDDEGSSINDNCVSTGIVSKKIWDYLMNKGLTKEQTAGVMGSVGKESFMSPFAIQNLDADMFSAEYKGGWGLFQWSGGRRYTVSSSGEEGGILSKLKSSQPDLVKYVDKQYGDYRTVYGDKLNETTTTLTGEDTASTAIPKSDLDKLLLFEMDYFWDELTTVNDYKTTYDNLLKQTDITEATVIFSDGFERNGASRETIITERVPWAQASYKAFKDSSASAYSSVNCSEDSVSQLIKYIKDYAWPKYIGKYKDNNGVIAEGIIAVTSTTAYQNAVNTAKTEGRYTGSSCSELGVGGGIDCGGFVTTLVYDSGYDKTYNYDGKGTYYNNTSWITGFTGVQIQWLRANWQELSITDSSQLQLGDIAIYNDSEGGHVFMFIGNIEGLDGNGVSASLCNRAPMVTPYEVNTAIGSGNDHNYSWFRKD